MRQRKLSKKLKICKFIFSPELFHELQSHSYDYLNFNIITIIIIVGKGMRSQGIC